jgi:hypothetical protein
MISMLRAWVVCALLIASCSLAGCVRAPGPPPLARLRVLAEPETTTVYVDERYVGSARVLAAKPRSLSPGFKLITFKAPGYFPHDVRLELPSGVTTVRMKLRKIPP